MMHICKQWRMRERSPADSGCDWCPGGELEPISGGLSAGAAERERAVRFFVLIGLGLDGHFRETVWLASSPSEIHFFSKQELCLSITVETRKQVPVQGVCLDCY